jgi:hypothetical protein
MMSLLKAALPFLGVLGAVAVVAGGAILLTRGAAAPSLVLEEGQPREATASVPALDAAAPAEVETATFALG